MSKFIEIYESLVKEAASDKWVGLQIARLKPGEFWVANEKVMQEYPANTFWGYTDEWNGDVETVDTRPYANLLKKWKDMSKEDRKKFTKKINDEGHYVGVLISHHIGGAMKDTNINLMAYRPSEPPDEEDVHTSGTIEK